MHRAFIAQPHLYFFREQMTCQQKVSVILKFQIQILYDSNNLVNVKLLEKFLLQNKY